MKVTWGWLGDWVDLPPTPEALAHALAMRGFPVASIERGMTLDPAIIVGRVLEVSPHPNADRLRSPDADSPHRGCGMGELPTNGRLRQRVQDLSPFPSHSLKKRTAATGRRVNETGLSVCRRPTTHCNGFGTPTQVT